MIRYSFAFFTIAAFVFGQAPGSQTPKAPVDIKPGSITNEDVAYPYPVSYLPLKLYGQDVNMAYMDVPPAGQPNGRTVMLFHGFNFGGFYFAGPIEALRREGFRVVVPDQIGFGRSSKPVIPYNFHDMALNSRTLLKSLGISRAAIVGHSMGGMLAARFASSYPDVTERVVLYNPIGLTDSRWDQPWTSTDDAYKALLAQTHDQNYAQAYGTIQTWMDGAVAEELTLDSGGSWIFEQTRGSVTQWIVWNPYGPGQIDLTYFPGADTVTPLSGSAQPLLGPSLDVSVIPELVSTSSP